jgi:hypothetical protein
MLRPSSIENGEMTMDATARSFDFPDPRLIYWVDAAGSLVFGIALIAAATPLTSLAGWSLAPVVLTGIGTALLPWALFNLAIARSSRPVPGMVRINLDCRLSSPDPHPCQPIDSHRLGYAGWSGPGGERGHGHQDAGRTPPAVPLMIGSGAASCRP